MMQFDPYLNWLGIPVHEQPPNFYRLLAVVLFESNPQVIEQAADRQSLLVGAFRGGVYDALCRRVLSEIVMARFNLLDPQQKAAYDAQLQQQLAQRGERAVSAPPPPAMLGGQPPLAPSYVTGMPGGPMLGAMDAGPLPAPPPPMFPQPMFPQATFPQPAFPQAAMPLPRAPLPTMPQPMPHGGQQGMTLPPGGFAPPPMPIPAPMPLPAAPPVLPPAAPVRPLDEIEKLTSQAGNRRCFGKKKQKVVCSTEMIIGGIAAVAGVVLVLTYLVFQSDQPGKSGFDAIGAGAGAPMTHKPNVNKAKPEKSATQTTESPLWKPQDSSMRDKR